MAAHLSGPEFAVKAAIRFGVFAALTFGFPFIVYGLILATNARSVGGASGALALVAGLYLKPIIVGAFLLSLIGPCWRRVRSLGMPGFIGLLVPILFLMDATFLMVLGAHWSVSFSLGTMRVSAPLFAITAISLLIAMSVAASPPADGPNGQQRFGFAGTLTLVLAVTLVIVGMSSILLHWWSMSLITTRPPPADLRARMVMIGSVDAVLLSAKPYLCIAFNAAVAWLVVQSRRKARGTPLKPLAPPVGPAQRVPPRSAFGQRGTSG